MERKNSHIRKGMAVHNQEIEKTKVGKKTSFIGRQKYRFGRGQGYVSIVNFLLLMAIAFHISNIPMMILVGAGTLFAVWLIGMADDRLRIVHAESDQNMLATTPSYTKLIEDIKEIKKALEIET